MTDLEIFLAEAKPGTTIGEAEESLMAIRSIGRILHGIYLRQCNGTSMLQASRDSQREERLEASLRKLFDKFGLGLYLNSDPRGNPIGILTPKTGRSNTMGGREAGWRL